jgi:hypothetical protein
MSGVRFIGAIGALTYLRVAPMAHGPHRLLHLPQSSLFSSPVSIDWPCELLLSKSSVRASMMARLLPAEMQRPSSQQLVAELLTASQAQEARYMLIRSREAA